MNQQSIIKILTLLTVACAATLQADRYQARDFLRVVGASTTPSNSEFAELPAKLSDATAQVANLIDQHQNAQAMDTAVKNFKTIQYPVLSGPANKSLSDLAQSTSVGHTKSHRHLKNMQDIIGRLGAELNKADQHSKSNARKREDLFPTAFKKINDSQLTSSMKKAKPRSNPEIVVVAHPKKISSKSKNKSVTKEDFSNKIAPSTKVNKQSAKKAIVPKEKKYQSESVDTQATRQAKKDQAAAKKQNRKNNLEAQRQNKQRDLDRKKTQAKADKDAQKAARDDEKAQRADEKAREKDATAAEKKAAKETDKEAREADRQAKQAEKDTQNAQKEADKESKKSESEARKAQDKAEREEKKAQADADKESKRAESQAKKDADAVDKENKKAERKAQKEADKATRDEEKARKKAEKELEKDIE